MCSAAACQTRLPGRNADVATIMGGYEASRDDCEPSEGTET